MTLGANVRQDEEDEEHSLGEIMDHLADLGGEEVTVNDILRAFEDRSTGVIITMLGLVAALPVIGAIPGVSITTGVLILVVIAKSMVGGGKLTLPGRLGRASLSKDKFCDGLAKGRKITDAIDRTLGERIEFLTDNKAARAGIKSAVAVLAVAMFPLAFVPWGVTAPAFGIVTFGLALIARDGLFALIGYALCAVTAAIFAWVM
jgi:hypothetical protein